MRKIGLGWIGLGITLTAFGSLAMTTVIEQDGSGGSEPLCDGILEIGDGCCGGTGLEMSLQGCCKADVYTHCDQLTPITTTYNCLPSEDDCGVQCCDIFTPCSSVPGRSYFRGGCAANGESECCKNKGT